MYIYRLMDEVYECSIVERVNRFVVLIEMEGRRYRARITNTGRLHGLLYRGAKGYCIRNRGGRTDYHLIGINVGLGDRAALIDTKLQEDVFYNVASDEAIPWLKPYTIVKRYPKVEGRWLDFKIGYGDKSGFIELKSAVLLHDGIYGGYPDCPSIRGRDHIRILINLKRRGYRAILAFVVAHPLAVAFKPYRKGDPIIASLMEEAHKIGVETYALKMSFLPIKELIIIENFKIKINYI